MTLAKRLFAISFVAFSLGACTTLDPATRNAPLEVPGFQAVQPSFDVTELRVAVPRALTVSEANLYYPVADIVWRGESMGDRHKQVLGIVGEAVQRGTEGLDGAQDVRLDVVVRRFHSLTEKARYTVGGVHSIRLELTVSDVDTGGIIIPTRTINADLTAFGGRAALEAENAGLTQKVRIIDHLTTVIEQELTRPIIPGDVVDDV